MTRHRNLPESQRQRRVGEAIRAALVHLIERGHFRDPDLLGVSVTVTAVSVSPDLRHATVRILRFGGGDSAAVAQALNRAAAYLRGQLAREVKLRFAPELVFEADTDFARAAELDRLFESPAVARDLAEGSVPGEAGAPARAAGDEDGDGA